MSLALLAAGTLAAWTPPATASETFTVTLEEPENGQISVASPLPEDGKVAVGTVLTVTATPDERYALDSGFYAVPGRFGRMYHEEVQAYADALEAAGQKAVYRQVEGAGHAFFDWKPDAKTRATFAKYGVPNAEVMKAFFDAVFYANREGDGR